VREGAPLAGFTEDERLAAMERFSVLRSYLEDGAPLAQLARQQHLPLRTLQRWATRYRRQGLAGLVRKPRADHGHHRRVAPELQQLIEGLALKTPPPTAACIHRQVTAVACEHGWVVPSYRTVVAIIQRLDPALVMLAHEGSKAYYTWAEIAR
jgi:putative transposase